MTRVYQSAGESIEAYKLYRAETWKVLKICVVILE